MQPLKQKLPTRVSPQVRLTRESQKSIVQRVSYKSTTAVCLTRVFPVQCSHKSVIQRVSCPSLAPGALQECHTKSVLRRHNKSASQQSLRSPPQGALQKCPSFFMPRISCQECHTQTCLTRVSFRDCHKIKVLPERQSKCLTNVLYQEYLTKSILLRLSHKNVIQS